jgi:hypothetical protein
MSAAVDEEIAEQIRDYKIAELKNTTSSELFGIADTEVAGAVEGGGFKVTKTQSDKVVVYDRKGIPSTILKYMLSKKLQQGFTLEDPGTRVEGTLFCYLHPESEYRAEMNAAGLVGRECRKSKIPTEWDLELHMMRKHKQEWAVVTRARERQEKAEAMQFQRTQAEALERMAAAGGTPQKRST